jgi:DNA mismatch endonuclease (patch repair protein)
VKSDCEMTLDRNGKRRGTDTVLIDFGLEDLEVQPAKVNLAVKFNELVEKLGLSQVATAAITGMTQSKVSQVRRYKLQNISLERLMQALVSFDQRVEIIVRPARRAHGAGIRVSASRRPPDVLRDQSGTGECSMRRSRSSAALITMPTDHLAASRQGVASRDTTPSAEVSRRMSRTVGRDNQREQQIRSALHSQGLRFRVHHAAVPGTRRTIDIAFPGARLAVLCDGCFWHGCPLHSTIPKTNRDWWLAKIATNIARDRDTDARLTRDGWTVLRVWEHVPLDEAVRLIRANLPVRRGIS